VIQRGLRNYAGARCPGKGWTCASTRHTIVQIASRGGQNRFVCRSSSCSVVQIGGAAHGRYFSGRSLASPAAPKPPPPPGIASCIKTTGLTQSCSITQSNAGGNTAMVWEDAGKQTGLTQTASYSVSITQTAGSGSNFACVHQSVNIDGSTTNTSSKGATATLEAHQSIGITQQSATGGNSLADATLSSSGVAGCASVPVSCSPDLTQGCGLSQTQILTSTATSKGPIVQNENKNPLGANLTLNIKQNCPAVDANNVCTGGSYSGQNSAIFTQTNRLSAIANSPAGATQWQSSADTGGILAAVHQFSTGGSTALARQYEKQCEDAAPAGLTSCQENAPDAPTGYSLAQTQNGPVKKTPGDSSQTGNPSNDNFTVAQGSQQDNDTRSGQTNVVSGGVHTDGTATINQTTTVNGTMSTDTQAGTGDVSGTTNCTGSSCTSTPPPAPVIDTHPKDTSHSSDATFTFHDADTSATFQCKLETDAQYTACSSPQDYSGLSDGSHTFSVEAVNPTTGAVSGPTTFSWTIQTGPITVLQLNPTQDPAGGNCTDGYASGTGFQGVPMEVPEMVDLSAFDGEPIQLRFLFDTRDANYNAFEGWYVKNILVTGTQSNSPVTVFSDPVATGDTNFTASNDSGVNPGWHVTDRRDSTFGGPAWWYGNDDTGTYQLSNPTDPCADSSPNSGSITSPVFTLANGSQLTFDTLWQIESVNPSTFDLMDVQVIPASNVIP
jgi:hypothetical protein